MAFGIAVVLLVIVLLINLVQRGSLRSSKSTNWEEYMSNKIKVKVEI